MKKIIATLMIIFPLTGCVPAALVVGATAGGAAIYDPRGIERSIEDRHITQTAQNMIDKDPYLKGHSNISVATYERTVLIVGQAQTPALRAHAYRIVASLRGVKGLEPIDHIWNEVTIAGPSSVLDRSNDAWLTTKVKTELLAAKGVPSDYIKVVTSNSVVYLMGIVTPAQGKRAADVARRVAGVQKVVEVFQYSSGGSVAVSN